MSSNFTTDRSEEPNERTSLVSKQPSYTPSVQQGNEMGDTLLTGSPAHLITANGEAGATADGLTGTVNEIENETVRNVP